MKLTHLIDIDATVKLTQGQGHQFKGQGHMHLCEIIVSAINIIIDIDEALKLTQGQGHNMKAQVNI